MKVIDLLNKIANGEEVPEKIKLRTFILTKTNSDEIKKIYVDKDGYFFPEFYDFTLNDEIEIIEEPKKIEKIKINSMGNIVDENNYTLPVTSETDGFLARKLNEIIDYIKENGDSNE